MTRLGFRDDLEAARDAVRERARLGAELDAGPRHHAAGGGSRASSPGDPTFEACARVMGALDRIAALDWVVRDASLTLDGCEAVMGRRASAARLHWLGDLTWREAGERLGVAESTARLWADQVVEWVDWVGVANARAGRGRAEE